MAGKHTPGPWSVSSTPISADQPFVAINGGDGAGISYMTLRPSEVEANAARIVACVNACEGIPNPSAIREVVEALRALVDHCWETEKALTEKGYRMDYCGESLTLCIARAALAKLEGRSNDTPETEPGTDTPYGRTHPDHPGWYEDDFA